VEQDHPVAGKIKQPGAAIRYSATPWQLRRPAPLLGQHNQEVLGDLLGYSHQDLVFLRRSGVI
jgi:crotonobetainyl-CoA:carnitine CoA-transferase CaiB-like acyl-CoA transferase